MNLLGEITEKDINFESAPVEGKIAYNVRKACRAVLFNAEGKVALLHVKKLGMYKLPGGGVEEGESYAEGLAREMMEETGCEVVVKQEVGMTIEYRNQWNLLQFSFCFTADVTKDTGVLNFMPDEIEDGFELVWESLDNAIALVSGANPTDYDGKFMQYRDRILLTEAKRVIG
jgi:8-oxo-dGTP diphosphatase